MKDKGLTEMKKYVLLFLLFCGTLFGQTTDRFERPFYRSGSDTLITGASIYIVNPSTGDSLLLTEHATKPGVYYRNSVAYGSYKIYVNGALSTSSYPFGISRARSFIEAIDSDGNNKIESGSFENGAIAAADLNSTLDLSGKSVTLAAGEVSASELASTLDLSSKTITYPDSQISLQKMTTATVNFIGSGGSVTNNPDDVSLESKSGASIGFKDSYANTLDRTQRNIINVTEFGRDGTAIARAIDSATVSRADSAIVYFPDGRYTVSSTINIDDSSPKGGIILRGGANSVIKFTTSSDTLFKITGATHQRIRFENLIIKGTGKANSQIAVGTKDNLAGGEVSIRTCRFDSLYKSVQTHDWTSLLVEFCSFQDDSIGIDGGYNSDGHTYDSNRFARVDFPFDITGGSCDGVQIYNTIAGDAEWVVRFSGGGSVTMHGGLMEQCAGIFKAKSDVTDDTFRNIRITNVNFQTNAAQDSAYAFHDKDHVVFESNRITGTLNNNAVYIYKSGGTFSAKGNFISTNDTLFIVNAAHKYKLTGRNIEYGFKEIWDAPLSIAGDRAYDAWKLNRTYTSSSQAIETWGLTAAANTPWTWVSGYKNVSGASGMWYLFNGSAVIGDSSLTSSAIFELESTAKGFLPPRMTTAQRSAISSPVEGLTVYNTSKDIVETYDGSAWNSVTPDTLAFYFTNEQITLLNDNFNTAATKDTIASNTVDQPVYLFDDASDEVVQVYFNTGNRTITSSSWICEVYWYSAAATSGNAGWGCQLAILSPGDATTEALTSNAYGTSTTNGTAGTINVTKFGINGSTDLRALAVAKIRRDADGSVVTDTMTGDAILTAIRIKIPVK